MTSPEKRCLYEVLGLNRDCTPDEIRSAYRKLALQRHPDKLIKSGVSESEATASFQELVNAYEVLSDARERAWYDSHRSQILFSSSSSSSSSSSTLVPDLFSYFSNSVYSGFSDKGKGFYKVYGDVFDRIYINELNYVKRLGLSNVVVKEAPLMGNLESGYEQVNAFYGYWLGFVTVMDFGWVDEYDVVSGPNRKSRRLMEEENKKIRKRARKEYVETVRGLAEFVKKRDKRVIDMQVKRSEEMERRKEEERVKKMEMARLKAERARVYVEPEWAKLEEEEGVEEEEESVRKNELYCVVCGKKFKSDKQWKNHEQSRKHKDKVAELREAYGEEDYDNEDEDDDGDVDGFVSADEVEKLKEQFEGVEIREEEKGDDDKESQSEEELVDVDNGGKGVDDDNDDDDDKEEEDDEDIVLKAMLNNRKNIGSMRKPKKVYVEVEDEEEVDLMEYNNTKGRRKRRGRKETAKRDEYEEQERIDEPKISSKAEVNEKREDGLDTEEASCADNKNNGGGDAEPIGKSKVSKQAPVVKVTNKKEAKSKAKNPPKGRKQKATSRNTGNECDTCGVDFDSRTKLHKHLNETGHATIKSR